VGRWFRQLEKVKVNLRLERVEKLEQNPPSNSGDDDDDFRVGQSPIGFVLNGGNEVGCCHKVSESNGAIKEARKEQNPHPTHPMMERKAERKKENRSPRKWKAVVFLLVR
jgi:hypothetical protein